MEKQMVAESESLDKYYQVCSRNSKHAILKFLKTLDSGYGARKKTISSEIGLSNIDFLTLLLKSLKIDGYVELIMIWSESTGLPDGSGYAITNKGRDLMNTLSPAEK